MKNKEQQAMEAYEAPNVEVIEVEIEKGFAASDDYIKPLPIEDWN